MFKKSAYDLTFGGTQPDFKLELSPSDDIAVLVGPNGVGKTMYLVCTWFIHHAMQLYQTSLIIEPSKADANFAFGVNQSIEMTFDNYADMSGLMVYNGHTNGTDFEFILQIENGKLVNYVINYDDQDKFARGTLQPAIYNSKTARSFSEYDRYQNMLEVLDVKSLTDFNDLKKLGKMYKLFDIMWFERITRKLKQWDKTEIPEYAKEFVSNFNDHYSAAGNTRDHPNPDARDFGHNANFVIEDNQPRIVSDTQNINFSQLGDGHQAVLMIHIFGRE